LSESHNNSPKIISSSRNKKSFSKDKRENDLPNYYANGGLSSTKNENLMAVEGKEEKLNPTN